MNKTGDRLAQWPGLIMLIMIVGIYFPAHASDDLEPFADAGKQALYIQLTKELRCLVCQNQNLADSNADLARDLRVKTREMVDQGMAYDEIVAFMVDRYGDFVLYRPPLKSTTLILWTAPFFLGVGLLIMVIRNRQRSDGTQESSHSDQEIRRAQALIDQSRDEG